MAYHNNHLDSTYTIRHDYNDGIVPATQTTSEVPSIASHRHDNANNGYCIAVINNVGANDDSMQEVFLKMKQAHERFGCRAGGSMTRKGGLKFISSAPLKFLLFDVYFRNSLLNVFKT